MGEGGGGVGGVGGGWWGWGVGVAVYIQQDVNYGSRSILTMDKFIQSGLLILTGKF